MSNQKVTILENILSANDQLAERNRFLLDKYNIYSHQYHGLAWCRKDQRDPEND